MPKKRTSRRKKIPKASRPAGKPTKPVQIVVDPSDRRAITPTNQAGELRLHIDDVADLLLDLPIELAPVLGPVLIAMTKFDRAQLPSNSCIPLCLAAQCSLDVFGIESRLEAVEVEVRSERGHSRYGPQGRDWYDNGVFRGHVILVVDAVGRFLDPTAQQFDLVPNTRSNQVPVVAQLPATSGSLGTNPIGVDRGDHMITYEPQPGGGYLWQDPIFETPEARAEVGQLGQDAAGETFMLLAASRPTALEESPHPRVRAVFAALRDAKPMIDPQEGPRFQLSSGETVRLHEVP